MVLSQENSSNINASANLSAEELIAQNLIKPKSESFINFLKRSLFELSNLKFALTSFVVNSLRRRYRRSVLGFAWSLLNPLTTMVVMTTVFSLLFHNNPKEFGIYIFTGILPWSFLLDSITGGSLSLVDAEGFLKKVYIPKLFFPLVIVSTEAVNFIFSLSSLMFLALALGMHLSFSLLTLPLAIAILYAFNLGSALFLAISTVYFRDLTHITRQLLQAFFYLVPICYPLNVVPPKYLFLFKLNPFYYFINLFRIIICDGHFPQAKDWLIPSAIAVIVLFMGFSLLKKTESDIIFRL